ncbi:hypothetical protein [Hymenobacter arizonensis]|uniref:Uncharacterized protein n=1 Tax=Hymenobacter arizonensis TaxID=1227077 RepID=A0A1I6BFB3_HYMAR|nr:hypothetical protein [Hymenobacter arizonensis]SFQ79638.1 hypothetical protein SAMN04515668_4470 [Hymenobacter arizonensis]
MKKRIAIALFAIYVVNVLYFSLNTFISASLYNRNGYYYLFPQYNSFVNGDNIIGRIFYTLRLNAAYSFFGRGLAESVEINFNFYDKNGLLIKKAKFAHGFESGSGQMRGNTLSNRLSFSLISKIESGKNQLKFKKVSSVETHNINKEIKRSDEILEEYLKRMGVFVGHKIGNWHKFDANIYFILPSKIGTYNSKGGPSLRKHFLYKSVKFTSVEK